jgi:hypothetical protein
MKQIAPMLFVLTRRSLAAEGLALISLHIV